MTQIYDIFWKEGVYFMKLLSIAKNARQCDG